MDKSERIENKKAELLQVYATLPERELKVAADLISQAAFLVVTLEDLAESISADGTTETYTNGANQSGRKVSSDAKLYAQLIGKYTTLTTRLLAMVPAEKTEHKPTAIDEMAKTDADKRAQDHEAQRERDAAFMDALKAGRVSQIEYKSFCDTWEREHGRRRA